MLLPPLDYQLSPFTGLTREHWCAYADHLLRSAHQFGTDDHANIHLPGANSRYGPRSDSLEAFARTFLLASFRMAGDPPTRAGSPSGTPQVSTPEPTPPTRTGGRRLVSWGRRRLRRRRWLLVWR